MRTVQADTFLRDGWWVIVLPEQGLRQITQAKKRSEVELMARECAAVTLELPLEEVAVEVTEI